MELVDVQVSVARDVRCTLALVLAGGRGARLQDLTKWRVKPAVPFGGAFRIIDFPLSNCINSGIRKIGVLTQYKSQSLIRHIVYGWGLLHAELGEFIEILPAQQRIAAQWYRSTADAVYQNIDIIRRYDPEYVLILAGDHVYKMDYGPMVGFHRSTRADLTIACLEIPSSEASRFGVLSVDGAGRVVRFEEKPASPLSTPDRTDRALASMGIYVFNTEFLFHHLIKDADDNTSEHDFGRDVIPSLVDRCKVMAYRFRGDGSNGSAYWRDVGTVDSYWEANMELIGFFPGLNLYDHHWPIHTVLRQYLPARFAFREQGRCGTVVDSMIASGCIISGASIENSLLFTNTRVGEDTCIRDSVILPDVVVGPNCRICKAVIDEECIIPGGTVIGVDHKQDQERYFVSPNGVVLVTPDMLGQMIHRVR